MSHEIGEYYAVYNEVPHSARKGHVCSACADPIQPGDRYCSISIVDHGGFYSLKRCMRCQKIHEHLRELGQGEMWPAERLDCGEEYRDYWGDDPPEEIAALAFALPGEVR